MRVTQRIIGVWFIPTALRFKSVFELTAVASAIPSNVVVSGDGVFQSARFCHVSECGPRFAGYQTSWSCGWCDGKRLEVAGNGVATLVGTSTSVYNGASWDRPRTPNVFKTAQATASGNTALWTPTSGKKFRLMRLFVQVTANAYLDSGAGVLTVTFQDATTGINLAFDVYLPAASVSAPLGDAFASGWIDLGNGVLSATANNVLNINLSGKVDAGNVRVTCCGTEE